MRITTQAEYGVICALHLAKRAAEGPIGGREIVLERGLLDARQLDRILSAEAMTQPGVAGKEKTK